MNVEFVGKQELSMIHFSPNNKTNVFYEVNDSELCCGFPELVDVINSSIAKSVVRALLPVVLCFR